MKILHTADWHLGQRLYNHDRDAEHGKFLEFLLETLAATRYDALLVSGDVFDLTTPPRQAVRRYYDFLSQARNLCSCIVITGGNHDSPAQLGTSSTYLERDGIHVMGAWPEDPEKCWVKVVRQNGDTCGYIAAVPFLRQRDFPPAPAGEGLEAQAHRIAREIRNCYQRLCESKRVDLPCVAMGHLYASGSVVSDSERHIHVGNLGQVPVETFPDDFAYVALGHLHRPQRVAGRSQVRYSGSPIPLSFSEVGDKKQLLAVELGGADISIEPISIPTFRSLRRFHGAPEAVRAEIAAWHPARSEAGLFSTWVEVKLENAQPGTDYPAMVQEWLKDKPVELLSVRAERKKGVSKIEELAETGHELSALKPTEVFKLMCESHELEGDETLLNRFREVRDNCHDFCKL